MNEKQNTPLSYDQRVRLVEAQVELHKVQTLCKLLYETYFDMSYEYHCKSSGNELLAFYNNAADLVLCLTDYLFKVADILEKMDADDEEANRKEKKSA